MSIEENMSKVLEALVNVPQKEGGYQYVSGEELSKLTGLSPNDLNDAVTILVTSGYLEWQRTLGTAPYDFRYVILTALGKYEYEKAIKTPSRKDETIKFTQPRTPVGSPYGFTAQDWEAVTEARENTSTLLVVFGHAFESKKYNTENLKKNVET